MSPALRFEGIAGRGVYVTASAAVLLGQGLAMLGALRLQGAGVDDVPWWFWFIPFRALASQEIVYTGDASPMLILGMVTTLAADAALVALAFRRATRIDFSALPALLVIVPVLQLVAIAGLAVAPDREGEIEDERVSTERRALRTAMTGVLVGVGLIVATVAVSTLVFHLYGYVLFLVSPFLIAVVVGYLANRDDAMGFGRTLGLVAAALTIGGLALLGFAFEGIVCLALAAPLIAMMGLVGAWLGRGLAGLGRRGRGTTLTSIAFMPLLLAAEAVFPPHAGFDSVEYTDIAAPPAAVWDAVVHMGPIPDAPAAPFRWGLAYPTGGEIQGTGVGSIRRGIFSTGVAYERVTEWVPNERLSFVVLSDPPTMRELSPYTHVNAPHDVGYFRTIDARFTIASRPDGRTRLTLATRHELDLEPALYWTPVAVWAVHANKVRVLAHFREQAEASAGGR